MLFARFNISILAFDLTLPLTTTLGNEIISVKDFAPSDPTGCIVTIETRVDSSNQVMPSFWKALPHKYCRIPIGSMKYFWCCLDGRPSNQFTTVATRSLFGIRTGLR